MSIITYARIILTKVGGGEATQQLGEFQRSDRGSLPAENTKKPLYNHRFLTFWFPSFSKKRPFPGLE
jgi:hypothetical protein